jgi:hypothetical protein
VPPKLSGLEQDEALLGTLVLQVVGCADARNAGTDDQYVEVLGRAASSRPSLRQKATPGRLA